MRLSLVIYFLTFLLLSFQSAQQILTNVPTAYQPRVEAAVHDCIAVATLVSVACDDCSTAFLRHFQAGDRRLRPSSLSADREYQSRRLPHPERLY
jgi:hypothetical protein